MSNTIIVSCPHCNCEIEIIEINCAIFRHAVFKNTLEQVSSHETQANLETWLKKGILYGCGKPFRLVCNENGYIAEICDYI